MVSQSNHERSRSGCTCRTMSASARPSTGSGRAMMDYVNSTAHRDKISAMSLATGDRLGPYEIVGPIGSGGMGEVYRARDTRLDRTVAIKILSEALAADPQFRERFDREAKAISQLDHPHICTLHDVGERNGTSYLVMQYLDGETLADRLGAGPLPLDE